MTHCSLFKEVAQRIVQNAQSSENDAQPAALRSASGLRPGASAQMSGSAFHSKPLTSPTDTLAATPD
jgi:hypothetical protein